MDYLQYYSNPTRLVNVGYIVLNLVINGLPSIHIKNANGLFYHKIGFKPCYKWITFNTYDMYNEMVITDRVRF